MKILAIGKLPKEFEAANDHYLKLLGKSVNIQEIVTKKNIQGPEVMELEGKLILEKLDKKDYMILLDVIGAQMDSIEFASKLGKLQGRNLVFVIGGAYGLSQAVKDRADASISLSKLTFPHMLARVILLEQIYRGSSILQNHPYHKA